LDLQKILSELRAERDRITQAIEALELAEVRNRVCHRTRKRRRTDADQAAETADARAG